MLKNIRPVILFLFLIPSPDLFAQEKENDSLPVLAEYFNSIAPELIIEFVPKEDEKVQHMLKTRPDTFPDYTAVIFENIFNEYFEVISKKQVPRTHRVLYHMKRR